MAVNHHLPHLLVLPEDDANRQIANGFHKRLDWDRVGKLQVLRPAGGWTKVVDIFHSEHIAAMDRHSARLLVLVIDCDGRQDRIGNIRAAVPDHLKDRVFVLGAWTEPEELKAALGQHYEEIGSNMADDCRNQTDAIWGHELLRHNVEELMRLRQHVVPILFPT
jgi:hypothetical protein